MQHRLKYSVVALLCVLHPAVLSFYLMYQQRFPNWVMTAVDYAWPWIALLWPAWGFVLWFVGARKLRLIVPLVIGAVAIIPSLLYAAFLSGKQ
ncbi:MAG: hypothetical protein WCJ07_03950 [Verrucomicrobiota bacterium]